MPMQCKHFIYFLMKKVKKNVKKKIARVASLLKKRWYLPTRLLLKPLLEACTFGREKSIAADTKRPEATLELKYSFG